MKKFQSHHLLSCDEAKEYVMEISDIFHNVQNLQCEEIGDGNINYIFRVKDTQNGKSIILKQADTCLRSSGRELDLDHNRIEAEVLQIQRLYAPAYIPEIYKYDSCMHTVLMEDISAYHNMRMEFIKGITYDHLPKLIADFLSSYLLSTSDIVMDSKQKKEWVKQFINPELCQISEDLVFCEPYNDCKKRNNIQDCLLPFVQEHIYQNVDLIREVAKLRYRFMNVAQSLLHGDLHTGSIFINQRGMKIIDPEFAFYGPMGYDIGNVIGNMIFPLVYHFVLHGMYHDMVLWLQKNIRDLYDEIQTSFERVYDSKVKLDLYRNTKFKSDFIREIMEDSLGYAGSEIIRRAIGDTKVKELYLLKEDKQVLAERMLLELGSCLIMQRCNIKNGYMLNDLIQDILEVQKNG